jgi:hypothetical protein
VVELDSGRRHRRCRHVRSRGEVGERRGGDFNVNNDFFCLSLFRMSSYLLGHCGVEGPRVTNFD